MPAVTRFLARIRWRGPATTWDTAISTRKVIRRMHQWAVNRFHRAANNTILHLAAISLAQGIRRPAAISLAEGIRRPVRLTLRLGCILQVQVTANTRREAGFTACLPQTEGRFLPLAFSLSFASGLF